MTGQSNMNTNRIVMSSKLLKLVTKILWLEIHQVQFSWPIPIFADSDFLSMNYN